MSRPEPSTGDVLLSGYLLSSASTSTASESVPSRLNGTSRSSDMAYTSAISKAARAESIANGSNSAISTRAGSSPIVLKSVPPITPSSLRVRSGAAFSRISPIVRSLGHCSARSSESTSSLSAKPVSASCANVLEKSHG